MPKYHIKSVAFNLKEIPLGTEPDEFPHLSAGGRDEIIDTTENVLFQGCENEWEVEDQYEAFWNRLNAIDTYPPPHRTHNPQAKVKVISVVRIDD